MDLVSPTRPELATGMKTGNHQRPSKLTHSFPNLILSRLKDYLKKKQTGGLLIDRIQDKLAPAD